MVRVTIPLLALCFITLAFSYFIARRALQRVKEREDAMEKKKLVPKEKTESDLLLELEDAIKGAQAGTNEYLFQVFKVSNPISGMSPCLRVYYKNKCLMDINAVNGSLMPKDSMDRLRNSLFHPPVVTSVLVSPSLEEIREVIKKLPKNFGFEFFLTTIKRVTYQD
jgi:hypothetical protein